MSENTSLNILLKMGDGLSDVSRKTDFKYKIGKVKQTPSVQKDPETGLSFIQLKAGPDEKVYGCTKFSGHYREEKKLGQGTFGEVYRGIHLETQRQVAMKRIIVNVEKDLFPITAQREITILRRLDHKNIIKLIEIVYDYSPSAPNRADQQTPGKPSLTKSFYMILPYMVSDLSGILHNPRINLELSDIKNMMLQLLESINYIHCQKVMHRDIKTANILIDHNGVLKLADFGLARVYYGVPPNLRYPGGAGSGAKYTSVVVTRWYRAPELVLGDKTYTTAVDIWGVGCVFAEFFEKKPILQGSSDIDQGHVIFKLLGTPNEESWPLANYLPGAELTRTSYPGNLKERFGKFLNETGLDFLKSLLALDPYKRMTAMSAVRHPFFKEEPLPSKILELPCEESHESDIKRYKEELQQAMSQKAPSAPRGHVTESLAAPPPRNNFPRAPARDTFPKGPAGMPAVPAMPGLKGTTANHSGPTAYNRASSRYEKGAATNSSIGSRSGIPNNYRQSENNSSRYNSEHFHKNVSAPTRFPTGPQASRYDKRSTGATSYNTHRNRGERPTYDRFDSSMSQNIDDVSQPFEKQGTNKQRSQPKSSQDLPNLPPHPRNDTWKPPANAEKSKEIRHGSALPDEEMKEEKGSDKNASSSNIADLY